MSVNTTNIISRIGETDQLYLTNNSPELALERGDLRLELATISHSKQEQIHFLQMFHYMTHLFGIKVSVHY